jgi:dTDP-4-dehydrorhamnose reductase
MILVIGKNGQLAQHLAFTLGNAVFYGRDTLDINNDQQLAELVTKINPEIIINASAYTHVDKAEKEQIDANQTNHIAVKNLAILCLEQNIRLIHISTDYVFAGDNYKPYKENDATSPLSVYGRTKLAGEQAIISHYKNAPANIAQPVIIRTSWLYSEHCTNFVKTMLHLATTRNSINVVSDQIGSPTYAQDLAEIISQCVTNHDIKGIFHFANSGVASWYDLAQAVMEIANIDCHIIPISSSQYPTLAPRPYYSVLNTAKIKQALNINIRHWREALKVCLTQIS